MTKNKLTYKIITSGSHYLDIDAYACCVGMKELLETKGQSVTACSFGECNYSVCRSLAEEGLVVDYRQCGFDMNDAEFIIADVSDPDYLGKSIPLDNVTEIYDHHSGFEKFWKDRLGENSHIEFIGAAATLIYREWKKVGLQDKMSRGSALLLAAAILDNTLNLTSENTTDEDRVAFKELCEKEKIGDEWWASYFSEVQENIEKDLENALFNDLKRISENGILPERIGQLCIWDATGILEKLDSIRQWLDRENGAWMINLIDIKHNCSYFICDDSHFQKKIENIFKVYFESGVAKSERAYLRKEIIKKSNIY